MNTSETITKIAPALVAALGKIEGAAKKAKNPAFKSVYANLESVIDASRDTLTENGLCVMQGPGTVCEGKLTLTTRIIHESGEWIETAFQMPLGKQDPQGTGSALTYARRYALMSLLNMPAVDDDAEAAHGRSNGDGVRANNTIALTPASDSPDFWKCEGPGMSAYAAKKEGLDDMHEQMRHTIHEMGTSEGMREFIEANLSDIRRMPKAWRIELRAECDEAAKRFNGGQGGAGVSSPRAA